MDRRRHTCRLLLRQTWRINNEDYDKEEEEEEEAVKEEDDEYTHDEI